MKTKEKEKKKYGQSPETAGKKENRAFPGGADNKAPGTGGKKENQAFPGGADNKAPCASGKKKRSRCPVSSLCGGCAMIDVPYGEQIEGKQRILQELIGAYVTPEPFIRMKAPEHYRHKVTSVFSRDKKGRPVCGIYREGTHEVVPVKACLIEHIQADRIVQSIYGLLADFRIRVYDEDMDSGLLRYVQIRAARATKEIMVTLVLTDPVLPSRNTFVKRLLKLHPEITTIVVNVNDRNTTMVLGNRETVIYGKGYIEDVLCGKRFRISSRSFYQVNPLMTEKLYNIAIDLAALSGKETVLDAYCGIGTIGIIAAPHARRVLGVELNADAVRDARHNIRMNGLTNVEILQGDATRFIQEIAGAEGSVQEPASAEPAGKEGGPVPVSTEKSFDSGFSAKNVSAKNISAEKVSARSASDRIASEISVSAEKASARSAFDRNVSDRNVFDRNVSAENVRQRVDVIFMDPPRSGSTEEFMAAACSLAPKKIVYISCSPWSLQRDLAFFEENGYAAKKAVPVDMFPYTGGIETVVLLTKSN